jgi:hypothetical protein
MNLAVVSAKIEQWTPENFVTFFLTIFFETSKLCRNKDLIRVTVRSSAGFPTPTSLASVARILFLSPAGRLIEHLFSQVSLCR